MTTQIMTATEMIGGQIEYTVKVNRKHTPEEAIEATGFMQYTEHSVVDAMPRGEGDEVELVFLEPNQEEYTRQGYISNDDLDKVYKTHGLEPDPFALAAFNEANPNFANTKPNITHWKGVNGKQCCAAFDYWGGKHGVHVREQEHGLHGHWLLAGVRKVPKTK